MNLRVALAWVERLFHRHTTLAEEDADDWLAGRDDEMVVREQRRRLHVVRVVGGEIG